MDLFLALTAGASLGLLHAFDIDHIVAVSTLTGRSPSRWTAARMGAMWGFGHTVILILVGVFVIAFNVVIPQAVQDWSEILVGFLLVGLGLWTLRAYTKERRMHTHRHVHEGSEHVHFHSHAEDPGHTHAHPHSLFALGMAHGFAGSGAVVVAIPIALADSLWSAAAFLAVFGLGSTLAMSAFSLLFSLALDRSRSDRIVSAVRGCAGAASFAVGCLWIGQRLL